MRIRLTGVRDVIKELNKIGTVKAKGIERGLNKAALVVKGASMRITPIDKGILRPSAFERKLGSGFDTSMIVGYSTDYAVYVHEDPNARHKEGTQYKFLEQPLRELAENGVIVRVVQSEVAK